MIGVRIKVWLKNPKKQKSKARVLTWLMLLVIVKSQNGAQVTEHLRDAVFEYVKCIKNNRHDNHQTAVQVCLSRQEIKRKRTFWPRCIYNKEDCIHVVHHIPFHSETDVHAIVMYIQD